MAKKKRVKKPVDYSLAQLQQLVESKESELADLKAKRAEIQKQLNELDQQISQTEGKGQAVAKPVAAKPAATKKKRFLAKKRPKNQKTAKEWAIEILGKEKSGLSLKDLSSRILEGGYKTTSANFSLSLYQVLYNAKNKGDSFDVDAKTGNWVLRK